ncbi:hypothetical protein [Marilutibacter maris]|uniref:hypothetical protein n=1 Tax=Marilutibacter maris TaxID=1605891 RepID=UPI001CB9C326|nr:hypothetical protein [Lysobacter maris]
MRRRLRMARRGLGYAMAVSLVLVALLLGVASQLLPLAERHPERIAAWLSERSGRPVAFDRVETEWTRRGPLLKLDNLRIGPGAMRWWSAMPRCWCRSTKACCRDRRCPSCACAAST